MIEPIAQQDGVFFRNEGDNWFLRNKEKLTIGKAAELDTPLYLIAKYGILPKRTLEIGCSNGWRLACIEKRYGSKCIGVEPSSVAIREGKKSYPNITLKRGIACSLPTKGTFDLVILSFVFHWVSRETLIKSIAEVDRVTADKGYVIIADFFPDFPSKIPYHHLPDNQVFTYKTDYASIFTSTNLYTLIATLTFDHDNAKSFLPNTPSRNRAVCSLLKKSLSEFYI